MAKFLYLIGVLLLVTFTIIDAKQRVHDRNDYTKKPQRLVCYFGSWATYHKLEPFEIEDIDIDLCTHVNYGFAKLNEWEYFMEYFDEYQDSTVHVYDHRGYERFSGLRKKNPNLTTMIALGGWWEGSEKYSDMAKDPIKRKRFIESVVEFLKKFDFDGIDMDWEYPGSRNMQFPAGLAEDKDHFLQLMTELRAALDPDDYLLTAALSPGKDKIDKAYVIPKLNELLDWANVMTYDYHGGWEKFLGHNAPLYRRPDETDDAHQWYNVNYTVHYYLQLGLEKQKFVMGVPFYGRGWTLTDADHVAINDKSKGMSGPGPLTQEAGILGYNEICQAVEKDVHQWTLKSDPYYRAPYLYNKTIWMGYENTLSVQCKVSFLKEMGLSGAMVWSLENDDFKNRCSGGRYPLLHEVNDNLNGAKKTTRDCALADIPEPSTAEPTTSAPTTQKPTPKATPPPTPKPTEPEPTTQKAIVTPGIVTNTNEPGLVVSCSKEGYQPHPTDKHKFIQCEYIKSGPRQGWWIHIMACGPETSWNQDDELCDGPP